MVILKQKNKNKFIKGGFRRFRTPSVFGSGAKLTASEKPKKQMNFVKVKYLFYVGIVASVLWLVFFSAYFKIKDVMIEGNKLVPSDAINKYIAADSNIFRFSLSKTRELVLSENAEIRDLQIYRGIPNAIKVVVLEEDPKIIWQTGDKKYLIGAKGKVAKEIEEVGDYPLVVDKQNIPVVLGEKIVSPNFIAFLININNKFFDITNLNINHFEIEETTFDLNVYTDAGLYIKFDTIRSSAKQLDNLKQVLVTKRPDIHEYVDLRIDGWGYYK